MHISVQTDVELAALWQEVGKRLWRRERDLCALCQIALNGPPLSSASSSTATSSAHAQPQATRPWSANLADVLAALARMSYYDPTPSDSASVFMPLALVSPP